MDASSTQEGAPVLASGKTKRIEEVSLPLEPLPCRLVNTDDTTFGDGKRHEVILGKAEISTRTTVNTFKLLEQCGFEVAFFEQDSPVSFIAPLLEMIKLEVVTRLLADGSYRQRHADMPFHYRFQEPMVEFYLKTKGRRWPTVGRSYPWFEDFPCDDPLMIFNEKDVWLYDAHRPFHRGEFFLRIDPREAFPVAGTESLIPVMVAMNAAIAQVINYAWGCVGVLTGQDIVLADIKLEYGFDSQGRLRPGDVIDGESGRVYVDGRHASKQGGRDGAPAETVKADLKLAADLSDLFPQVADDVASWTKKRYDVKQFKDIFRIF